MKERILSFFQFFFSLSLSFFNAVCQAGGVQWQQLNSIAYKNFDLSSFTFIRFHSDDFSDH